MRENLTMVADQTQGLPPELVESILACLPLAAILGLSSAQPSISECALTSNEWRELHHSLCGTTKSTNPERAREEFLKLQELFHFYLEVQAFAGRRRFSYTRPQGGHAELDNILGAHGSKISRFLRNDPIVGFFRDRLNQYIATTVATYTIKNLQASASDGLSELVLELRDPGSSSIASIRESLLTLRDLDHRARMEKHRQLQQMADLVEAHPLRLKKPLDPSQTPAESKSAHLLAQLRTYTRNVLRGSSAKYFFHSLSLPIVPYDRCVRLLIAALETEDRASLISAFNLPNSNSASDENLHLDSKTNTYPEDLDATTEIGRGQSAQFTNSLSQDLNTAVAGLFELYDTGEGSGSPRIWWESRDGHGGRGFEQRPRVATEYYYKPYADLRDRGPVYQRELTWLKAFLRMVEWTEERCPVLTAQIYSDCQEEEGQVRKLSTLNTLVNRTPNEGLKDGKN